MVKQTAQATDHDKHVHHSAIITGWNADGELLVTYAGAGEEIRQITLAEATRRLRGVPPAFRRWIQQVDEEQACEE